MKRSQSRGLVTDIWGSREGCASQKGAVVKIIVCPVKGHLEAPLCRRLLLSGEDNLGVTVSFPRDIAAFSTDSRIKVATLSRQQGVGSSPGCRSSISLASVLTGCDAP